jgi:uncharacterized phage protein (TIGR02218 family)
MSVSEAMKVHLSGNCHLACFLKITSKSGEVLNVWNGTRNKIVGGELYYAYPLAPSRLQSSNGLSADNLEATAVYSGLFNAATLRAKKWLGARVEYQILDYKRFDLGYAERRVGFLGQTETGKFAAKAEVKSLIGKLSEPVGLTYQKDCDVVRLGDARCKVDLNGITQQGFKITMPAIITAPVLNPQQFSVQFSGDIKPSDPAITIVPDDFYEFGEIEFVSGANAGARQQILTNAGNDLTTYLPLFYNVAPGDQLILIAGCNRKITVCRDKYNNALNNRSFFMLPGRSRIFKFPD